MISSLAKKRAPKDQFRFGIGEWYGQSFVHLTTEQRSSYAHLQALDKKARPAQPCPFRGGGCSKTGGVCSLRLYHREGATGHVLPADGDRGRLRATCPNRFLERALIFSWIGDVLLGTKEPGVVAEVGFLEAERTDEESGEGDDVGRIDHVLVHPAADPMRWCALEIQAVYFSGASMGAEFAMLRHHVDEGVPFPSGHRRPDDRSSGPKRLMPQLQIKVPSLRRWGKKMAVVVDEGFFGALGKMDEVKDVSNCDIAWFVVRFHEAGGNAVLEPSFVRLTTLERAVEGLTGGNPVSLETFEARIRAKL
ncbi:MAG TPA: NotI family restriction endonuclease [Bryobacteraceae bacterium]|nr:NotI family restriction endonuclease [Bryobacteraceae bacterium]